MEQLTFQEFVTELADYVKQRLEEESNPPEVKIQEVPKPGKPDSDGAHNRGAGEPYVQALLSGRYVSVLYRRDAAGFHQRKSVCLHP